MDGGGVKMVVEVYGGLPWRKNLHGSLNPLLIWWRMQKMEERESGGGGEREGEKGICVKLKIKGDIYSGEKLGLKFGVKGRNCPSIVADFGGSRG